VDPGEEGVLAEVVDHHPARRGCRARSEGS
jgi:hypothetical protein